MDEALAKLVITVPSATAVIVTVWLFLKSRKTDHEMHQRVMEVVNENTKVLVRLATLIDTRIKQINGARKK